MARLKQVPVKRPSCSTSSCDGSSLFSKFPKLCGGSASASSAKPAPQQGSGHACKKKPASSSGGKHPPCIGSSDCSSGDDDDERCSSPRQKKRHRNDPGISSSARGSPDENERPKIGRRKIYTGTCAGIFKIKYREGRPGIKEDMEKLESVEGKVLACVFGCSHLCINLPRTRDSFSPPIPFQVKKFFGEIEESMRSIEGIDMTIWGYQILGQGLRSFVLDDEAASNASSSCSRGGASASLSSRRADSAAEDGCAKEGHEDSSDSDSDFTSAAGEGSDDEDDSSEGGEDSDTSSTGASDSELASSGDEEGASDSELCTTSCESEEDGDESEGEEMDEKDAPGAAEGAA